MKTSFEQAGTFPTLGPLGRTVRLALGALVLFLVFPPFLKHHEAFTRLREGWEVPGGNWYLPALFALYLLPITIDRLLTVNWGWRSPLVWGALGLGLAAFNLAYYESLWAPPLGWFLLLTILFVFGVIGLAFLVQGVAGTPG